MGTTVQRRHTLAEIAHAAGCSKAVVSTVLNGSRGNTLVGPELRERVQRVAREVGYVPNHASQSLARGLTHTIGVYITPGQWVNLGAEYESAILRGIDLACREAGRDLLIFNLSGERAIDDCVRKIASNRVDGVLVVRARRGSEQLARLRGASRHVVAVDFNEPEPADLWATSFDNAVAMRLAVDHLVELGHQRIGYVGGPAAPVPDDLARRSGFHAAIGKHKLNFDPLWMFCGDAHPAEPSLADVPIVQNWGWAAVDRFVAMGADRPSALVVWSDSVAVAMVQRFSQLGLRIPNDISLIGVDNSQACRITWPQLTSINHPLAEMGVESARMLFDAVQRDQAAVPAMQMPNRRLFQPSLVIRGTTGTVETSGLPK